MNLLRLLILAGLGYFIYRMLSGKRVAKTDGAGKAAGRMGQAAGPSHDVLVRDPACGVLVPKGQALALSRGGETFYFCSAGCRDSYLSQQQTGDSK